MSAMELVNEVQQAGGTLIPLPGGRLKVRSSAPLPEPLLQRLRAAKPELLRTLASPTDATADPDAAEWIAHFNERAAMREFCGGLPRAVAEELAWDDTLAEWHRAHPTPSPAGQCAGCGQPMGRVCALRLPDGNEVHFDTLHCIARWGENWRSTAALSLKALGIEWPAVRGAL